MVTLLFSCLFCACDCSLVLQPSVCARYGRGRARGTLECGTAAPEAATATSWWRVDQSCQSNCSELPPLPGVTA